MKNILLLITITMFLSCKKDREISSFRDEIVGTWEFEKTISFEPADQNLLIAAKTHIIIYANGTIEKKRNDSTIFRGNYQIKKTKEICPQYPDDLYMFTSQNDYSFDHVEVADNKLKLGTPVCYQDGGITYYKRVN